MTGDIKIIKQRFHSIDLMKFLAVLLITNSHMAGLYPSSCQMLATGGAIGDALFFFCSGFLLMRSRGGDFFNWYKRRVNRIFPTIFAVAIFGIIFFGTDPTLKKVIVSAGGWFVQCIFVFYAVFWFVKNYAENKIWIAFLLDSVLILGWYLFFWDKNLFILADSTYLRWPVFFLSMLLGAQTASMGDRVNKGKISLLVDFLGLVLLIVLYYGYQLLEPRYLQLYNFQIVLTIILLAITFLFFRICSSPTIVRIYTNKHIYVPVYWMSSLCLEAYLCQTWIFPLGKQLIFLFPLNMIISFALIFSLAYAIKVYSNFLSQTFRTENYDWKKMVKL